MRLHRELGTAAYIYGGMRDDLDITPWTKGLGIVQREDGIDQCGGEVATALASFDYNLGDVLEDLRHILGLAHLHKAYGSDDHPCRLRLAAADKVAELDDGSGGISHSEERIGMLLDSEANTCLGACDAFLLC